MLTIEQLFGKYGSTPDATPEYKANGAVLVRTVNVLMAYMINAGITFKINPLTGSVVSGESLGGFRPKSCPIGASHSAHKEGMAVDIYDPDGKIDSWLFAHEPLLAHFGLYFEHPTATPSWSHWSTRAPTSGHRFFYP
jgi:hypothetical protein